MKVLIFRIGSIGDTVVALPAFHLIARRFEHAERRVLANVSSAGGTDRAVWDLLQATSLIDGFVPYTPGNSLRALLKVMGEIRAWKPDLLIYLMPKRSRWQLLRDRVFFRACGIRSIVGLGLEREGQASNFDSYTHVWEPEAARLGRLVMSLGKVQLQNPGNWDLQLTDTERRSASQALENLGSSSFIGGSVSSRIHVKDWGEDRWTEWAQELSTIYSGLGLVLLGSQSDTDRALRVARAWKGKTVVVCGKLTPRESAAVIERAVLFVGHDGGPMHLAAAVGTPCVAIFSARSKPGEWFPIGKKHRVLYHQTPCFGCNRTVCEDKGKICIRSISVQEVLGACRASLDDLHLADTGNPGSFGN